MATDYRNYGIARKLVAEVERRLGAVGIEIIAVLVENWNSDSLEVFDRLEYIRNSDIVYFSKRKDQDV